jgi:linoleoyl-CoA desaturase
LKNKTKHQVKFVPADKSDFFDVLKKRVDSYFTENHLSKYANGGMVVKTIVLIIGYLLPFILLLIYQPPFAVALLLWVIMGISLAGIGMSVMHDANHGAYSSNKTVNYIVGHSLNALGGSVLNWKLQHNILHHTYTNITHLDDDIDDKLMMRFSPHTKQKKIYKYQFIFVFFFYGILTLYWALAKDFIQFVKYTRNGVNTNTAAQNVWAVIKMIIIKAVYFYVFLIMPTQLFHLPFYQILSGFLLMHFFSGIILTTVFQLAHTIEETTHPMPNERGTIENLWAIHQLNTTANFSPGNKWISWYVGGLNYQVEHHLFPRICHMHYPQIAPIVKQTAEEYGIPYLENKTFFKALNSHIRLLQELGKMPDINEALA